MYKEKGKRNIIQNLKYNEIRCIFCLQSHSVDHFSAIKRRKFQAEK